VAPKTQTAVVVGFQMQHERNQAMLINHYTEKNCKQVHLRLCKECSTRRSANVDCTASRNGPHVTPPSEWW